MKGYSGDRTLVCLHCYSERGDLVPLVVKGKHHGRRRTHFAHPGGAATHGHHGKESIYHAEGKQLLARWAREQPGVERVTVECTTPDGRRRSDVGVRMSDGTTIALEVQYSPLSDQEWLSRHEDYTQAGVVDIWFWHARLGPQGIVIENGGVPWTLDVARAALGVPLGMPHERRNGWCNELPHLYAIHHPPHPDDTEFRVDPVPLNACHLSPSGVILPGPLVEYLNEALELARMDASDVRGARRQIVECERQIAHAHRTIQTRALRRPTPPQCAYSHATRGSRAA